MSATAAWPQWTMAAGLLGNTVFIALACIRARRVIAPMRNRMSRWQRFAVDQVWLAALLPASEAWVLWMGGFWS